MTNPDLKVKCAVLGAGWWGTTAHLPAIRSNPHALLIAVQSRSADRAEKISRDFGARTACTTAENLLAIPELDAVVISSTANMHFEHAKAALERGLHVLVEKPMTITADEAFQLVSLAAARRRALIVSCPWHYTEHAVEARRLIASGALGQLKMITILMTNFSLGLFQGLPWAQVIGSTSAREADGTYLPPGQTSYSDATVAGGGQIYTQVSHPAALIGFLTGSFATEVFARFDNHGTAVDVHNVLNLRLDDGTLVSLASTGATMPTKRQFELRAFGTDGLILMELWDGTLEFHRRGETPVIYPRLAPQEVYPLFAPVNNLIDVARGAAENGSPGEHGLCAMEIIEAACASATTGRNIAVKRRMPVSEGALR